MADLEVKFKHSLNRKRNIMAKALYDPNEFKGAYAMKVHKNDYKRTKLRVTEAWKDDDE